MKMMNRGENKFTLTELPVVVAMLGIMDAVIISNIGTFMTMGAVSTANSEAQKM